VRPPFHSTALHRHERASHAVPVAVETTVDMRECLERLHRLAECNPRSGIRRAHEKAAMPSMAASRGANLSDRATSQPPARLK